MTTDVRTLPDRFPALATLSRTAQRRAASNVTNLVSRYAERQPETTPSRLRRRIPMHLWLAMPTEERAATIEAVLVEQAVEEAVSPPEAAVPEVETPPARSRRYPGRAVALCLGECGAWVDACIARASLKRCPRCDVEHRIREQKRAAYRARVARERRAALAAQS